MEDSGELDRHYWKNLFVLFYFLHIANDLPDGKFG